MLFLFVNDTDISILNDIEKEIYYLESWIFKIRLKTQFTQFLPHLEYLQK